MTIKKPVALVAGIVLLLAGIAPVAALADHITVWPHSPEANNASYWETWPAVHGGPTHADDVGALTCDKIDQSFPGGYELPAPPDGYFWRLLVIKDGAGDGANFLFWNPNVGQAYVGQQGGVSHVIRCLKELPDDPEGTLSVEKSAAGRYDRTVEWELEKSVDPDTHNGVAGEIAGASDWTVVATKTEVSDNYQVSGTIEVSWTGEYAVTVNVTDSLPGASIDCGDGTATIAFPAAAGTVSCSYSVGTDGEVAENTATATPVDPPFPTSPASDTATIQWTESLTGDDEVQLVDDQGPLNETLTDSEEFVYEGIFECPTDASLYVDGVHEFTVDNVATLTGPDTDEEAHASVDVTCVLDQLSGVKTAEGSFDRMVTWELEKSVDPDSHVGGPGDEFTSEWTVTATKTVEDTNFTVTGTITVDNDTAIEQTFTVIDELDDGTVADVDCGEGENSATVPAGGSVECTYEAFPDDASATLNTATISAPGNPDVIVTAEVEGFTENLDGDDGVDLLDLEGPLDETLTGSEEFVYEGTFECPGEDSDLYVDGEFSFEVLNVASLTGDNTDLEAEATVTVDCILDEVLGEVIDREKPDEPDEVLGVVRTATTTLPKTGASTLLLILLGLSAVGTGTTLVRRRR